MPEISVLIEAGKATASAPLGPALGPLGVNIGQVVADINKKTQPYAGMKIPVKVIIDSATKAVEIEVGSPPTSAIIRKELGIAKGAADPKADVAGNITLEQVKKVAEMKMGVSGAVSLKSVAKEIIGACQSMGITVEGKKARAMQREIAAGKHDAVFGAAQG